MLKNRDKEIKNSFINIIVHGLHVIIGTLFLLVGAIRIYSYQVTNTHHVGVEGGILY
jgi:cytochrome c oxidase subunit 3